MTEEGGGFKILRYFVFSTKGGGLWWAEFVCEKVIKWVIPGLFFVLFKANITIFATNLCETISIRYMMCRNLNQRSYNHWTNAPAQRAQVFILKTLYVLIGCEFESQR